MKFNMEQVENVNILEITGNFIEDIEAIETESLDFGELKPEEPKNRRFKKATSFADVEDAEEVHPVSQYKRNFITRLNPLSAAGVQLSNIVLLMIGGVILLLFTYLFIIIGSNKLEPDINKIAAYPDSVFQHHIELLKFEQENKKSSLDSVLGLSQTILLNLLLPVLTAILGYIFGTREASTDGQKYAE